MKEEKNIYDKVKELSKTKEKIKETVDYNTLNKLYYIKYLIVSKNIIKYWLWFVYYTQGVMT